MRPTLVTFYCKLFVDICWIRNYVNKTPDYTPQLRVIKLYLQSLFDIEQLSHFTLIVIACFPTSWLAFTDIITLDRVSSRFSQISQEILRLVWGIEGGTYFAVLHPMPKFFWSDNRGYANISVIYRSIRLGAHYYTISGQERNSKTGLRHRRGNLLWGPTPHALPAPWQFLVCLSVCLGWSESSRDVLACMCRGPRIDNWCRQAGHRLLFVRHR